MVSSKNCNSGHTAGQTFILDVDGNFITKLCPKRMCVYLISQLTIPVALINERLSEGLEPNDFHFMRQLRCLDTGVDCYGYGEVMLKVQVDLAGRNRVQCRSGLVHQQDFGRHRQRTRNAEPLLLPAGEACPDFFLSTSFTSSHRAESCNDCSTISSSTCRR